MVLVLALVARRFDWPGWIAIPVFASPIGYWIFINGQIEWLALSGLLFVNGFDILVLLTKPQVAIGAVVPRFKTQTAQRIAYLTPALLLGAVSLFVWRGWPIELLSKVRHLPESYWNASVWPWGIPIGLFLLWQAWHRSQEWLGMVATPFVFPYVNLTSFIGSMVVLAAKRPRIAVVIWAGVWLAHLLVFLIQ